MKQETTKISNIQLADTSYKIDLYLNKIQQDNGPSGKMEKLCHLATQTFSKCSQSEEFTIKNYDKIKAAIYSKRNYYFLYLVDQLLKNNKYILKAAKKDVQLLFRHVWEKVWVQPKNSYKIQCLKAMARTWGVIYGAKLEESIKKMLIQRYNTNLKLSDKNEEILRENYEKHKNTEKQAKYGELLAEMDKDTNTKGHVQAPSQKKQQPDTNLLKALDLDL